MRTPRRRALRKRGRRADAPYQGASAALSVATLAFARALGRHEQACRHTARGNFCVDESDHDALMYMRHGKL